MKRFLATMVTAAAAIGIAMTGCSQSMATPTAAPAQPKASEPANPTAPAIAPASSTAAAPAPQPTSAPAKKIDYPAAGRALTIIVAFDAGSASDTTARLLQPYLEKELGIPVQVLDRPGAGGQVGITELAKAKPDGYTIGYTPMPNMTTLINDPQRQAAFARKDFQPLAMEVSVPDGAGVLADSPYKTLQDVVNDANARPGQVKMGVTGIGAGPHLQMLQWEKAAGVKFAPVHFDSGAAVTTALLGKNVDVKIGEAYDFKTQGDRVRMLGVFGSKELPDFPGIKTFEAQGYKVSSGDVIRGICMPAGAPKEIVDTLAGALQRAITNPEHVKKVQDAHMNPFYGDPAAFATVWDQYDATITPLIPLLQTK